MSTTQPDGYLALPASGTGHGVLVLHPWWGLNATIKAFCDRLAEAGFVAFAPDLYHGKVTDTIDGAEALSTALFENSDQAEVDVDQALAFLRARAQPGAAGLAVIGFSMGASFALALSAARPEDIRSVVVFYGAGDADFSQSNAEYLAHFAEADPYEPPSNVEYLEDALKQAGRPATFYHYSGTGHWFFEPDRADAYNEAAAKLAWERTLAFLKRSPTA